LRGRPQWQDIVPSVQEARDTYAIAARNEVAFSRAFLKGVGEMLPEKMPKSFKGAYDQGSAFGVEQSLLVGFDAELAERKFRERVEKAYIKILQESGEDSTRLIGRQFDIDMSFSVGEVEKAICVPTVWANDVKILPSIITTSYTDDSSVWVIKADPPPPINNYSIRWMRKRVDDLITQNVTKQQRLVIQDILANAFEKGLRAETVYAEIKANIGLTEQASKAVERRRILLEEQGFFKSEVEKQIDKYRGQLLKQRAQMIARTETIAANAAGRKHAWQLAQDSGQLPEVERVWITAPPSPNPNRPCEICLGLDGKKAPINGTYESIEGSVEGPPAHPSCRCSETLRRIES
jgi:hypothetical protein